MIEHSDASRHQGPNLTPLWELTTRLRREAERLNTERAALTAQNDALRRENNRPIEIIRTPGRDFYPVDQFRAVEKKRDDYHRQRDAIRDERNDLRVQLRNSQAQTETARAENKR